MTPDFLLILSSCPDAASANIIAKQLVEHKLAACVQVSAEITSTYIWEDEVCQSTEVQLQIKCLACQYHAIEQLLIQLHPYEVPELIATPITHGLAPYLTWIKETTQS
ncbi:divalent-cation tolerance protein CutA [Shewanella gaetbuli]|uniref:Divalent-cation tolerance protein CutA n=1 Tax=Shewanella gaetbuli TaxID=220752 RepID=A0A9X2CJL2_9GAMM|nr:divalent-cation tolerance protein CutA [Shewanella gaetbuli]MCL1142126.1 divalent-cation tolerance protein CutA [Shewanella gaetbuli]